VRPALAVGEFRASTLAKLDAAAGASAFDLSVVHGAREAAHWLEKTVPSVLVVDGLDAHAKTVALNVRAESRLAQLPILAVGDVPHDLAFADLFSWGGDDLISLETDRHLIARLRGLPREEQTRTAEGRGNALIADADRVRRLVVGRVLRNAGYSVSFAVTLADLQERSSHDRPELVVASLELLENARESVEFSRARGETATWIVACPPRELRSQRALLEGLDRAAVTDGFAPPENVLFLANELRNAGTFNQRASKRLLYGTTVAFRGAGREQDDFGYTYNVSEGGLYVRTLAPPDDDLVWLELAPPRSERRVRLVGKVAWRRRFGPNERATVPHGFGVQIVEAAQSCLTHWRAGYAAFAEMIG
jgi:DNA-binding response OmpR family regulator